MNRTSLLAATAALALATASFLTVDADARTRGGFARHAAPARHVSQTRHLKAAPARHWGTAYRVSRHNSLTHSTTRPSSTRAKFGQRHQNGGSSAQAHQHPTNQLHPNTGNAQSHQNAGGLHAKLKPGATTSTEAHPGSAQMGGIKNRITKIENKNVQNTANADIKAGNADIAKATQLKLAAAKLQKQAKTQSPTIAAMEKARATADLKQAAKLNNQGQNLVNTGTAEKAVVTKGGQATQAQIQQVQKASTADQKQGNADIAQANALRASAAALQKKAAIDGAKGDKAEQASDLARADAASKQAAQLDSRGQGLLKNAQSENAVVSSLKNKATSPNGNTASGNGNGNGNGNTGNPKTGNAANGNGGNGNNANGSVRNPKKGDANSGNADSGGNNASVASGPASAPAAVQTAPSAPRRVASAVTTPPVAAPTPGVTGSFKALSLVWNRNGGWVVRAADALDAANEDAMTTCNGQFGGCKQAMTVESSAFGCLAVMSYGEHHLVAATGHTLEAVTASVQHQLELRGQKEGELVYSGCNNR
jgi:hypothetical protein